MPKVTILPDNLEDHLAPGFHRMSRSQVKILSLHGRLKKGRIALGTWEFIQQHAFCACSMSCGNPWLDLAYIEWPTKCVLDNQIDD